MCRPKPTHLTPCPFSPIPSYHVMSSTAIGQRKTQEAYRRDRLSRGKPYRSESYRYVAMGMTCRTQRTERERERERDHYYYSDIFKQTKNPQHTLHTFLSTPPPKKKGIAEKKGMSPHPAHHGAPVAWMIGRGLFLSFFFLLGRGFGGLFEGGSFISLESEAHSHSLFRTRYSHVSTAITGDKVVTPTSQLGSWIRLAQSRLITLTLAPPQLTLTHTQLKLNHDRLSLNLTASCCSYFSLSTRGPDSKPLIIFIVVVPYALRALVRRYRGTLAHTNLDEFLDAIPRRGFTTF